MSTAVLSTMIFSWKEGVTPDQVASVTDVLNRLREATTGVERFDHGPDLGLSPISRDYGVSILFTDTEHWRAYLGTPLHHEFRDLSGALAAETRIVQIAG
jgi:hypothetical protein